MNGTFLRTNGNDWPGPGTGEGRSRRFSLGFSKEGRGGEGTVKEGKGVAVVEIIRREKF